MGASLPSSLRWSPDSGRLRARASTSWRSSAFQPRLALELDVHLHDYWNRLPILGCRLVLPLLHGIERSLIEHRYGLQNAGVDDFAVLSNGRLELDGAIDAGGSGDLRIDRRHVSDFVRRSDRSTDADR